MWQVHRVKSKELEDLKRSYKESIDELETLRTKVCTLKSISAYFLEPGSAANSARHCPAVEMSGGRASALGGRAEQVPGNHQPAEE